MQAASRPFSCWDGNPMNTARKRAQTVGQLERQIDALLRLCGAQLKRIRRLEKEGEKLRARLAAKEGKAGEATAGGGEGKVNLYNLRKLDRRLNHFFSPAGFDRGGRGNRRYGKKWGSGGDQGAE